MMINDFYVVSVTYTCDNSLQAAADVLPDLDPEARVMTDVALYCNQFY